MELRDIRYFLAVANSGSFTRASINLHISQPTISRQIKLLEEELGAQLLLRENNGISLTPAGLIFKQRCEQIVLSVDNAAKEAGAVKDEIVGTLSIGTGATMGSCFLPPWIKQFHDSYPNVKYKIWRAQTLESIDLLRKNLVEIAFLTKPFNSRQFESISLLKSHLGIIMHPEQIIGDNPDEIRLSELKNIPFILPNPFSSMVLEAFILNKLDEPNILCDSKSINDDLMWVKEKIAVAITPYWSLGMLPSTNLIFKKIIDPVITVEYLMVWCKGAHLSQPAKCFIDFMQDLIIK